MNIEHADALQWLAELPRECATAAIFDPPYAVGTPVRGREDGAAGSVFEPFGFLYDALAGVSTALRPGGIVLVFADWRRIGDLGRMCSMVGLRPAAQVAWIRNRPGTGGLLRSAYDPILIASRGVPDAVDRAAIKNVVETDELDGSVVRCDYESRRAHPYGKPPEVYAHILRRVIRPGDLVIDPFAGSGSSRTAALGVGAEWRGCDIDPQWAS